MIYESRKGWSGALRAVMEGSLNLNVREVWAVVVGDVKRLAGRLSERYGNRGTSKLPGAVPDPAAGLGIERCCAWGVSAMSNVGSTSNKAVLEKALALLMSESTCMVIERPKVMTGGTMGHLSMLVYGQGIRGRREAVRLVVCGIVLKTVYSSW